MFSNDICRFSPDFFKMYTQSRQVLLKFWLYYSEKTDLPCHWHGIFPGKWLRIAKSYSPNSSFCLLPLIHFAFIFGLHLFTHYSIIQLQCNGAAATASFSYHFCSFCFQLAVFLNWYKQSSQERVWTHKTKCSFNIRLLQLSQGYCWFQRRVMLKIVCQKV